MTSRFPAWGPSEIVVSALWKRFAVAGSGMSGKRHRQSYLTAFHPGLVEFPQFVECVAILERGTVQEKVDLFLSASPNTRAMLEGLLGLYACVLPEEDLSGKEGAPRCGCI